jgi:CubicO group peptidase (beta-lactamase class C family)
MTDTTAIDAAIDNAIAGRKLVGVVVMLAQAGEITYRRAAGLADREAGTAMAEDTIFRAASLTKPLVAATALAMAESGFLRLDDPVTDYLPYFRPSLQGGPTPTITLRHLITHTAGLTYDYSADPRISAGLTDSSLSLDDILALIAEQPLAYAPGTQWMYSVAIDVLGGVVAKVQGSTLGAAVAHYVTGPLGMKDTAFHVTDRSRLAVPYADGETEPVRMGEPHAATNPWGGTTTFSPGRIFNERAFHSGGAGMATTAPDFMRFLTAITMGGSGILGEETTAEALRNQLPFEREPGQAFSFLGSYNIDPARSGVRTRAGTNNWGGIYGHIWSIDPERKICAVSLSNTAFYGGELDFPQALRAAIHAD